MDLESEISINKQEWDYTEQAPYYSLRPNYAEEAIDKLCEYVGAAKKKDYVAADIGAGTANLTLMLVARGLKCIAIEPNAAMRKCGIERTKDKDVEWLIGTGEETTLENNSVDLFAMGSSFNTTDRQRTLKEAHRVLKEKGHFTCMWNHRDIENDSAQKGVEEIIKKHVPNYSTGTRREDQTPIIQESGLFENINYFEAKQIVSRTIDEYIKAWRSVRNPYWDLKTEQGRLLFNKIVSDVREFLSDKEKLEMTYITKVWIAQKTG